MLLRKTLCNSIHDADRTNSIFLKSAVHYLLSFIFRFQLDVFMVICFPSQIDLRLLVILSILQIIEMLASKKLFLISEVFFFGVSDITFWYYYSFLMIKNAVFSVIIFHLASTCFDKTTKISGMELLFR